MESDLSESDRLRKLQEETLSKLRLECSNVETKNIEKERYPRIRARIRTGVWAQTLGLPDGPRPNSYVLIRNPKKDKTIEEFKEGTSNLKKHLEELEIKLESGWFSQIWLVSRS